MPICKRCRFDAPSGSGFCPRCGNAIDDGLGRGQNRLRVIIAILVGVLAVAVLASFFIARPSSVQPPTVSTEVRKL